MSEDEFQDFNQRMTNVETKVNEIHGMIQTATDLIQTTLTDAKPTLDRLMNSPMVKLLAGGGK